MVYAMSKAKQAKNAIRSRRAIALRDGAYHKVEKREKVPMSFSVTISDGKFTDFARGTADTLTFNIGHLFSKAN